MGRSQITLLQRLMEERHLTHADTIRLLERRARQMGAADFTIGERTLDHWLSGTLRTTPQPVRRRVLEAEFGHGIGELLAAVDDEGRLAPPRTVVDRRAVSAAAARSARFAQRADDNAVSDLALEQLRLRLAQLSAGYVHTPIWPVFTELTALRDDVFDLLEAPTRYGPATCTWSPARPARCSRTRLHHCGSQPDRSWPAAATSLASKASSLRPTLRLTRPRVIGTRRSSTLARNPSISASSHWMASAVTQCCSRLRKNPITAVGSGDASRD